MRVATCTPFDFPTDGQFFGRDTGLLCRGFQALGCDCVVVMPGDPARETHIDVVRTAAADLSDSAWWRALKLDLVVLYAWGDPRYQNVATAIREAGIKLVQSLDTAGLATPYGDFTEWRKCLFGLLAAPFSPAQRIKLSLRALRDFIPAIHERKRVAMLANCDALAAVSEPAMRSVAGYVSALGHPEIAEKLRVVPHAVVPAMVFRAGEHHKTRKVLVVGRWAAEDRVQKDPDLTVSVIGRFLREQPEWKAEIVGKGSGALDRLTRTLGADVRSRLTLTESIPRDQLVGRYQESSILLCASRFESFHISSAEALCCGCSIVVADHPLLASTGWFTTKDSGTLAPERSASTLLNALIREADVWRQGGRYPQRISSEWCELLHADRVAANLVHTLGLEI